MRNLFLIGFVVAYLIVFQASAQNQPQDFRKIHDPDDHKNLEIKDNEEFKIQGAEYLAISYLEPLPGGKYESSFSIALLKKINGKYVRLFEKVVCGMGSPNYFAYPFLFESKENKFIVFEIFCGGKGSYRNFCIVKVSQGEITEIPMDDYYSNPLVNNLLKKGENTYCRGPEYTFKRGEITGTLKIYKEDDACCCPTAGGVLVFSYRFNSNIFKIVDAKRYKIKDHN